MLAIFKREFKAYFTSPIGYVILAVFWFFSGLFFSVMFSYGSGEITFIFQQMFTVIMFVIPILTMRLLSEDKRQKTDQALLTAPVRLLSVALGKFFAALAVFMLGFAPTLIYQIIVAFYVTPQWAVFFGNVLGILFFGSALISVGLFISGLTESQVVAAIGSFAVSLVLLLLDSLADMVSTSWLSTLISWISFSGRYETFTLGIFDYSNAVFFVSFTAVFLLLTVQTLNKKRWA